MKKFLIAGSSLAAVAAAGSAGAVDVTLGGSIDMNVKYGVGKDTPSGFAIGENPFKHLKQEMPVNIAIWRKDPLLASLFKHGQCFSH